MCLMSMMGLGAIDGRLPLSAKPRAAAARTRGRGARQRRHVKALFMVVVELRVSRSWRVWRLEVEMWSELELRRWAQLTFCGAGRRGSCNYPKSPDQGIVANVSHV